MTSRRDPLMPELIQRPIRWISTWDVAVSGAARGLAGGDSEGVGAGSGSTTGVDGAGDGAGAIASGSSEGRMDPEPQADRTARVAKQKARVDT
jgi:hypothetical protein